MPLQTERHLEMLGTLIERLFAQLSQCADDTGPNARGLHNLLLPLMREYRMTAKSLGDTTTSRADGGGGIPTAAPATKAEPAGRAAPPGNQSNPPAPAALPPQGPVSGLEIAPPPHRNGNPAPDPAAEAVVNTIMDEKYNAINWSLNAGNARTMERPPRPAGKRHRNGKKGSGAGRAP